MTFNYRVLVNKHKGDEFFQIHEVYYNEDGTPISYTEEGIAPFSDEGVKYLAKDLRLMLKAIKEPILWAGDRFPEEYEK